MIEDRQDVTGEPEQRPQPPVMLSPGAMVEHFKVVRLLGSGGFGDVYLARDTKLGRKVALKLLNTSQFTSQETAQRFLYEARATAKCNHPHIVAIYGVGEHKGNPYVALEYLEGQTLRDRMAASPPTTREAMRIGLDIGAALREAHGRKVLHGDLKPENVLIPRDGRLRLFDFGLAMPILTQHTGTPPSFQGLETVQSWPVHSSPSFDDAAVLGARDNICGTPEYMAPEQWLQQEVTGAADIWALGVILYELVSRKVPFTDASLVGLALKVCSEEEAPAVPASVQIPEDLRQLIADCLLKIPDQRPTARELVERLERMVYRRRQFVDEGKSPFPGLLPFSERYADFFFGREPEINAFLERMREVSVLPVVGPSGAGKSSFVEAGIIPRLKEQGPWMIVRMRPGGRPFVTLAGRLRAPGEGGHGHTRPIYQRQTQRITPDERSHPLLELDPTELGEHLYEKPSLLGMLLGEVAEEQGCKILLFVDQLEEVYTLVDDPELRRRFMEAICGAADDPQDPVRVIFTLRDDFLGRLAEGGVVREALSQLTVMRSPGAEALREILVKPTEAMGYRYDDTVLVDEMVATVEGQPASLPLLQFATRMLWDHRDRKRKLLKRVAYQQIGGVEGALADHADGVLQGLSPAHVSVARELLLRLVTPDGTRRVLPWGDALQGLGDEAEVILNRLIQSRLVLVGKGRGDERAEAELELVHESLVRRWYRLARWFSESREDLAVLTDLDQAATLWEKRGCHEHEVWQGKALVEAEETVKRATTIVPERVRRFLDASWTREQRVARRRRGLQIAGVALLCVVTLGAVLFALALSDREREASRQRDRAEAERGQARMRSAEALREAARAALLRDNTFEARARLRASLETEDSVAARALWWKLNRTPLVWKKVLATAVYDAAFSPDGRTVAAACQDKTIYLFDVKTHAVRFLRGHRDQVYGVAFSPDGKHLASTTWGGEVGLWHLHSGKLHVLAGHKGKVHTVAFSPDGVLLASASYDKTVRIWHVPDGKSLRVLEGHTARAFSVAFSPDGKSLASAGWDGTVRLWNPATGEQRRVLRGHGKAYAVAFSPDGKSLASGGEDKTVRIWDAATGEIRKAMPGHQGVVHSVAFSPDGRVVASGSYDETVRIWDPRKGEGLEVLTGHRGWVLRVVFSSVPGLMASASADRTVRLWDLRYSPEARPVGHRDRVFGAAISHDGVLLATGGWDNNIRIWNLKDGTLQRVLAGHGAGVFSVAFSPDGTRLVSGSWDKTIRIWDVAGGTLLHELQDHTAEVSTVAFSPDGKRIASGSWDATVRLWDASRGKPLAVLAGHQGAVYDLAFRPDGRQLASAAADQTVRIWDVAARRQAKVLGGHDGPVYGVSYSPDGRQLVTGCGDGTVHLWSMDKQRHRLVGQHGSRVYHLAFHPDGRHLGTPSSDGTARLWDVATGKFVELRGHHAEVNFMRFSPDGQLAVTTSDDGTIRTWRVESGLPYWRAPLLLPSPPTVYTHRGWWRLDTGARTPPPAGKWRRVVEREAVLGAASTDGNLLALVTSRGALQLWDRSKDQLLFERPVPTDARDPHVLANGSVVVAGGGRATLYDPEGNARSLVHGVRAMAREDRELLVATDRQILVYDAAGTLKKRYPVDLGVTAMAYAGRWLAVGNEDGNIELIPRGGSDKRTPVALKEVPATVVLRLLPGPAETLVAGYANGLVGIWSLRNGARLLSTYVHGPVDRLHLDGERLYAVTSLGDRTALDLGVFNRSYCALLGEIWRRVPAVWEQSAPVLRPLPQGHRCAGGQTRGLSD